MRNLVFVLIALLVFNASAQNRGNKTPKEMAKSRTEQMAKDLDLTESQQTEILALNLKNAKEFGNLRGNRNNLSEDERKELRSKMKNMQVTIQKEMKEILTDKQYAKWDKMQKERMNKRRGQSGKTKNNKSQ